jgi:hypothetical protein
MIRVNRRGAGIFSAHSREGRERWLAHNLHDYFAPSIAMAFPECSDNSIHAREGGHPAVIL